MRKKLSLISVGLLLLLLIPPESEAKEFKQIQEWKHGDQGLFGSITYAAIDKDRDLVVGFGEKFGWRVINLTQIKVFIILI